MGIEKQPSDAEAAALRLEECVRFGEGSGVAQKRMLRAAHTLRTQDAENVRLRAALEEALEAVAAAHANLNGCTSAQPDDPLADAILSEAERCIKLALAPQAKGEERP